MTKKVISVLLCVLTIISVFTIVPATSAGAASYKDDIIDMLIKKEDNWYDKSLFDKDSYYDSGSAEFIDFDFDGNLEFVLHVTREEQDLTYNQVILARNGELVVANGGDENVGYGGYYGSELTPYYVKSTGAFKFLGNAMLYESPNAWIQQNFSMTMSDFDEAYLDVNYFSGKIYLDGKTTYFGKSNAYCDLEDSTAVSSSKYKSINSKQKSGLVKAKITTKKIDLSKWYSYSKSKKKSLLSQSYDAFKLSSSILSTPALPTYESKGDSIKLKWKAVSGAVNYRVYRKTSSTGSWKSVGTTKEASFVDKKVEPGKKYIYTIRCINKNGKYAVSSYNKTGKTVSNLKTPQVTKIDNAKDGVKITWGKVSGAEKYRVYVKKDGKWKAVANTTSTTFTHKGVESDKTYTYTVRCTTKSGKTFTSGFNSEGWTIKFIATPVLKKVTSTTEGVNITWNPVVGAENYRVYVKGGEFKSWTKVDDTTGTSLVHLQPESGVKYTYTVACMSADSKERISSFDSKGLSINYIAAPVITSGEVDENGIKLTWDKVDGAAKYRVFVKSGTKWVKLKDTTAQSFTHKNLVEGNSYTYTVRCISSTGKSYTSAYNKDGWTFDYVLEIPTEEQTQIPTYPETEPATQVYTEPATEAPPTAFTD